MARTSQQWNSLSPSYRARLERGGITESKYVSGESLSRARGQSNESLHRSQLRDAREYGPKDKEGDPLISARLLQQARAKNGDQWVSDRLAKLKSDSQASARGLFPHGGDKPPDKRNTRQEQYGTQATPKYNQLAYLYWYRGIYG